MKTRFVLLISVLFLSCGKGAKDNQAGAPPDWVMTKELQAKLTPDSIISILKKGNENFYNFKLTAKDDSMRMAVTKNGQYPMAAVLSCIDSRVPVERIFDRSIGDLFVARVAGNIINPDILGSLEYSCEISGSKLVIVLGHEGCGAVKGAIDNEQLGNVTQLLAKIKPAVDSTQTTGERTSKNKQFVHDVIVKNMQFAIKRIRKESPVLAEAEKEGKVKIIGAIYDIENGKITFY
jgi:carbonic anhydrase